MENILVGREKEISTLQDVLNSTQAEFVAVYGRRRVGKTFLIKQFFKQEKVFFEQTGLHKGTLKEQLHLFSESLGKAFYQGAKMSIPKSWMEALKQLSAAMDTIPKEKRIILFFDELPWLSTPRSGFLKAFEHYWNTDWCFRQKLILIVCGSAASWMIEKLIYAKGGLHNRITVTIPLRPFTLKETAAYLSSVDNKLSQQHILQLYMVTGGVAHYLRAVKKGLSATQNIDRLCFQYGGLLLDEFDKLFRSLYEDADTYIKIVRVIAKNTGGISREKLISSLRKISSGGTLNNKIKSLEEAGFISTFIPLGHAKRGVHYRVIDEYVLFYLAWIEPFRKNTRGDIPSDGHHWLNQARTPAYYAWAGYAFEAVCFKHIGQIKTALGLERISCGYGDWRYSPISSDDQGTQIDLLFDRDDDCVTICEIKNTDKPFFVTKDYVKNLESKRRVYVNQTRTSKLIFMALISNKGAIENDYYKKIFSSCVTAEDLFK
ncbi:MAG: AAA family ATPase [Gammaproteobacteria bacterium RIFCSPHIGHO2_12_FULL_38_11]|nr:MAG: AAA family ATPase [Gammaproteobacteria bacterium RIFCSPHIGHO2_12_FULL_38_11]